MAAALPSFPMQPAKLDIAQIPSSSGTVVAQLTGKLGLETVSGFLQDLRPVTADKLVLNMSGVSFLDSAGVGALVQIFVHRKSKSHEICFSGTHSTRSRRDAGFWPGEAPADLRHRGRSLPQPRPTRKMPRLAEFQFQTGTFRSFGQRIEATLVRRPRRMRREESVHDADLVCHDEAEQQA